jgi:hypothetical protein
MKLDALLAMYTRVPSGEMATPSGSDPTTIVAALVWVATSWTVTLFAAGFDTYRNRPSGLTAAS